MIYTMVTTMDAAGRLVIPREIRREAGIEPHTPLEVRWRDGVIEIEPQPLPVTLEKRGRFLVAVPSVKVPPLTDEVVERTKQKIRRGR